MKCNLSIALPSKRKVLPRSENRSDQSLAYVCVPIPLPTERSAFTGALLQFRFTCLSSGEVALDLVSSDDAGALGTFFIGGDGETIAPDLTDARITCTPTAPRTPEPDGEPTPGPSPEPTDTLPPKPAIDDSIARPGAVVEKEISATGGRIDSADGRLTIEFPDEAVSERLSVKLTHRDFSGLDSIPGQPFLGVWEIEAFALDRDRAKVHEFPSELKIITNYTPEDFFGLNPDTLALWTWNEEKEAWEPLNGTHVPYTGTTVAEVDHFSIFSGTASAAVLEAPFLEAFQTDLHTGASQVTVPIEVPPARGGLAPNLTLVYNSNLVNEMKSSLSQGSWVGIGWDLSVGAVRKVFVPGGAPRYFLDVGGVSDELIETGAGWRTKHHQYLRIEEIGNCDTLPNTGNGTSWGQTNPPCHWVVTDKLGTKYFLGGTPESGADRDSARFYDSYWTSPAGFHLYYYRWDLRQVVDTHDNKVEYEYFKQVMNDCPFETSCTYVGPCDSGILCQQWVFSAYPTEIAYNGEKTVVDFVLGSDYDNSGYVPGIQMRHDSPRNVDAGGGCGSFHADEFKSEEIRFLDRIDVKVDVGSGPSQIRTYQFTYTDTDFRRTGLAETPSCMPTAGNLTMTDLEFKGDGGGLLNKMHFTYSSTDPSSYYSRPFALYDHQLQVVDDLKFVRPLLTPLRTVSAASPSITTSRKHLRFPMASSDGADRSSRHGR